MQNLLAGSLFRDQEDRELSATRNIGGKPSQRAVNSDGRTNGKQQLGYPSGFPFILPQDRQARRDDGNARRNVSTQLYARLASGYGINIRA